MSFLFGSAFPSILFLPAGKEKTATGKPISQVVAWIYFLNWKDPSSGKLHEYVGMTNDPTKRWKSAHKQWDLFEKPGCRISVRAIGPTGGNRLRPAKNGTADEKEDYQRVYWFALMKEHERLVGEVDTMARNGGLVGDDPGFAIQDMERVLFKWNSGNFLMRQGEKWHNSLAKIKDATYLNAPTSQSKKDSITGVYNPYLRNVKWEFSPQATKRHKVPDLWRQESMNETDWIHGKIVIKSNVAGIKWDKPDSKLPWPTTAEPYPEINSDCRWRFWTGPVWRFG